jgi:hypothetical protein
MTPAGQLHLEWLPEPETVDAAQQAAALLLGDRFQHQILFSLIYIFNTKINLKIQNIPFFILTFYCITGLLLFQVCYWIALSEMNCYNHAYIHTMAHWALDSGFRFFTRILWIIYLVCFSGNWLSNVLEKIFKKKWIFLILFIVWSTMAAAHTLVPYTYRIFVP